MRGAIAEVEDYARVSVATRSQAALAGSAVADVIHLLAELVENATTLSPPYTSVRVSGDTVANGFAIEVEDRGLGMSPQRLAELNERLASPPEFNPSDSEQLGLFVVSQLAKRHGIQVTLKASPYGGTSAIVLIPAHLVVTEEAFRAGLPGEQPAAIGTGRDSRPAANGNHWSRDRQARGSSARDKQARSSSARTGSSRAGSSWTGRPAAGQVRRYPRPVGTDRGADPGGSRNRPERCGERRPTSRRSPGRRQETGKTTGPTGPAGPTGPVGPTPGLRTAAARRASTCSRRCGGDQRPRTGRLRRTAGQRGMLPVPGLRWPRRRQGGRSGAREAGVRAASYVNAPTYPSSPPYPGAGSGSYPHQAAPFPGWGAPPAGPSGPPTRMTPVASPQTGPAAGPPWELPGQTGPPSPAAGADDEANGLPRRVKQASLAPQLRDNPPGRTSAAGSGVEASGPTPEELRKTMAALQRGWQEGRAQPMSTPAPGDPRAGPGGQGPPAGQGPPEGTTSERGRAAHEPPGGSDGT